MVGKGFIRFTGLLLAVSLANTTALFAADPALLDATAGQDNGAELQMYFDGVSAGGEADPAPPPENDAEQRPDLPDETEIEPGEEGPPETEAEPELDLPDDNEEGEESQYDIPLIAQEPPEDEPQADLPPTTPREDLAGSEAELPDAGRSADSPLGLEPAASKPDVLAAGQADGPSYLVSIPAELDFGPIVKNTGENRISSTISAVELDVGYSLHIRLASENNFTLAGPEGTLGYTVKDQQEQPVENGGEIACFRHPGQQAFALTIDTSQLHGTGQLADTIKFFFTLKENTVD